MFGFKSKVKEFDVEQQSGIGGTHALWQMYDAFAKKNRQPATVWVLDKKALEKAWFKKDAQGLKTFLDYMRREAQPTIKINLQIRILQPLEEDSSYMIYVTNRVQTTLFSLLARFGDLENAKRSQQDPDPALSLIAPDLILYGFSAVAQDLALIHEQSLTFGNLTPANIAILPSGEWCLVGFAMAENNALQYQFNDDTNAWFRPSAWCMTPKQVVGKYSSAVTDCAQLVFCLFTCFGNRQANYQDTMTTITGKKFPDALSSIENLTGKLLGVCPAFLNWSVSPSIAGQNANLNERFWGQFANSSQNYYCLSRFGPLFQLIMGCAQEKCTNAKLIVDQLMNLATEARIMQEMTQILKMGGFQVERPTKEHITLIQNFFKNTLLSGEFSIEFLQTVLLKRVVQSFCNQDLHPVLIPLMIKINKTLSVPKATLFLLFEPIVISCTKLSYRSLYEKASKTADYAAFTGVPLAHDQLYRYKTPYFDVPLDRGYKDKDRNKFCPAFDEQIDSQDFQKIHEIIRAIYTSLDFFFSPETGGRSHCYTLNMIMSTISCKNERLNTDVFRYLQETISLMADQNWMMEEDMAMKVKFGNTMSEMTRKMQNTFQQSQDIDMDKKTNEIIIDYRRPITNALTPCMIKILRESGSQLQMYNILNCMGYVAQYFSDEQIGRVLLPQINNVLDNIQKYPKAIAGFALFSKAIYQRCSGRTVSSMFMPRLLKMLYVAELVGSDLDQVRAVCDELWRFISNDCLNKNAQRSEQQARDPTQEQPAQLPAQQYQEQAQPAQTSYQVEQPPQTQAQQNYDYDPYGQQFAANTDYNQQGGNYDPWAQGQAQDQGNQGYQQNPTYDYNQGGDYSTSNYQSSAANQMDW